MSILGQDYVPVLDDLELRLTRTEERRSMLLAAIAAIRSLMETAPVPEAALAIAQIEALDRRVAEGAK
jgi:hypothetical protein